MLFLKSSGPFSFMVAELLRNVLGAELLYFSPCGRDSICKCVK